MRYSLFVYSSEPCKVRQMYDDCMQTGIHLNDFIGREAKHEQKGSIEDAILRMMALKNIRAMQI